MKISSTFHVLVFLMAVLPFSLPFTTLAQQNSVEAEAIADAAADANRDVNKPLWFGSGCLLSGLAFLHWYSCLLPLAGLAGSYFYRPHPPTSRLLGKSPEYMVAYTSAYKSKSGNIQDGLRQGVSVVAL